MHAHMVHGAADRFGILFTHTLYGNLHAILLLQISHLGIEGVDIAHFILHICCRYGNYTISKQ